MNPIEAARVSWKRTSMELVQTWSESASTSNHAPIRRRVEYVYFGSQPGQAVGLPFDSLSNPRPVVRRVVGRQQHHTHRYRSLSECRTPADHGKLTGISRSQFAQQPHPTRGNFLPHRLMLDPLNIGKQGTLQQTGQGRLLKVLKVSEG